jgi:DNA adenine methylase
LESNSLSPVAPVRPVAPYVGGKRNLAKRLTTLIETVPHVTYAEPFVGMGGIFLRRRARPKAEVINDLSGDVSNLFRILQRHYVQFMDTLRFGITTRAEFERLCRVDPETLTDLERAGRFLYLQSTAFGGKVEGRNFGVQVDRPGAFDVTRLGPLLEDVHTRLAGVTIERLRFDAFVERYDRLGTLFYCDPPYWGTEDYYGRELFSREDFARLADVLRSAKGRFVLSINDVPQIRELFSWAELEPIGLSYGLASGSTAARELIITSPG